MLDLVRDRQGSCNLLSHTMILNIDCHLMKIRFKFFIGYRKVRFNISRSVDGIGIHYTLLVPGRGGKDLVNVLKASKSKISSVNEDYHV